MYRFSPLLLALFALGCGADAAPLSPSAPDLPSVRQQASLHVRELLGRLARASALLEDDKRAEAFLDSFADFLAERVFMDANYESEEGASLVLLLRSEASCDPDDEVCIDLLDRLQLRLRIHSASDPQGLIVEVQSGARHPFLIRLSEGEIAIEIDLPEAEPLLRALLELREPLSVSGERPRDSQSASAETNDLLLHGLQGIASFELLRGRLELLIGASEGERVEMQLSVLEGVEVSSSDPSGVYVSVEEAIPALTLSLNPEGGNLDLEANIGRVDLRGPADTLLDGGEEPLEGRLAFHLGGLEARTSWLAGMSTRFLPIEGFGLGDETSTITLDGAPLLSLDLNPQDGRRVDLQISEDPELGTVLQVVPALELHLGLRLANFADQFEVPAWALDETFRLRLDDAPAPAVLFREVVGEEPAGETDAWEPPPIEVLAGRLVLESKSTRTVLVPAGMCLRSTEPARETASKGEASPDKEEEHLLDRLEAGVCR